MRRLTNLQPSRTIAVLAFLAATSTVASLVANRIKRSALNNSLVAAIKGNETSRSLALLSQGADPDVLDDDNDPFPWSMLTIAVKNRNAAIVTALLDRHARVNRGAGCGPNELTYAKQAKMAPEVERLVKLGCHENAAEGCM
jgi:hypothetical protein